MSASPSNRMMTGLRWGMLASLLFLALPASAIIVIETEGLRLASDAVVNHGVSNAGGNASYLAMRSRAWTAYRYGRPGSGERLVVAPYAGSLNATSGRQVLVRSHIARAQAYRLGDRW